MSRLSHNIVFVVVLVFLWSDVAFRQSSGAADGNSENLPNTLVMRALDGGAVFTLLGSLKPMSSDIWSTNLDGKNLDMREVDRIRSAMAVFNDEHTYGDVITIAHTLRNVRTRRLEAVVFDRDALAKSVQRHSGFFGPLGITKSSHPLHVAVTVEHLPDLQRHRGYGYLFGYPDHAVDFFVDAEKKRADDGKSVPRDFIRIQTFGPTGTVWAVPKSTAPNEADKRFVREANRINEAYRSLRAQWGDEPKRLLLEVRKWKAEDRDSVFSRESSRRDSHAASRYLTSFGP